MGKFKVGDIITGIDFHYSITNSEAVVEVIKTHENSSEITVKIINHQHPLHIGQTFGVKEEHFKLVGVTDWRGFLENE